MDLVQFKCLGRFEAFSGFTIATSTSVTGIGVVGGGYMIVDDASNIVGGFSRMLNGFSGNEKGDSWNFMKNDYTALSSYLGFDPKYGEDFYNATQLAICVYSLATGVKQLPGKAFDKYNSFCGHLSVGKGAETYSYFAKSGSTITKSIYTTGGLLVKSISIDLNKLATGVSLIGLDSYNVFSQYKSFELEFKNIKTEN